METHCKTKGIILQKSFMCSESTSKIWCCFSHSKDSWVQESKGRNGNGTTVIPRKTPAKFVLPVPATLYSAGLEILFPKKRVFPPGDITLIPLNWKVRLTPRHFGLLMLLNQQERRGIAVLAGVSDSTKGKLDYYSTVEKRKRISGIQVIR